MKGIYLILCLTLARDIAGSIFRPQFDPRMANLVVQPLELTNDQQSIEQHHHNRHHPRQRHVSSEASASRSDDSNERVPYDGSTDRRVKAPIHDWNSALYSTVIGQDEERQTYDDVITWRGKPITKVPSPSVTNEKNNDKSSIFYDSFITMKHMTDQEKKRYHDAYQTAVQTSNEDVQLDAPELLAKHHYEVEEHAVKTDDGYILTLFRIPPRKEHSGEDSKERSEEKSKERSKEDSSDESKEGRRKHSEEKRKEHSKERSSEESKEHRRELNAEKRKEHDKEHSAEESKEHIRARRGEKSRENSREHSGEKSEEHSKERSGEKSKEHYREHSEEKSKEHSGEKSKEHSGEKSKEHSREHSEENSKERSKEKSKEDSKEHSKEHSKERSSDVRKAPVVFLMHGLLGSADDWLLMGPGKSLAYLLADAGFDVWLGNARGNKYSRRHVSKHPAQPDFWQFTTDEIALHDLPAMIDYVLHKTKQQKLVYVGHSQGTTAFFALTSTRPEYNDKIKMMYAISPMVYMENVRSPLLRMVAANYRIHGGQKDELLGKGEFKPNKKLIELAGGKMCEYQIGCKETCSNVYFVMAGINPEDVSVSRIPVILNHLPAGASIRQVQQYGQAAATHEFRKYDYGADINQEMYGQEEPPKYNMSKVRVPVALYYSERDWLSHPEDVNRLREELPNVKDAYKVPEKQFTHTDFQFSKKAPEVVYKRLIKSIRRVNDEY